MWPVPWVAPSDRLPPWVLTRTPPFSFSLFSAGSQLLRMKSGASPRARIVSLAPDLVLANKEENAGGSGLTL